MLSQMKSLGGSGSTSDSSWAVALGTIFFFVAANLLGNFAPSDTFKKNADRALSASPFPGGFMSVVVAAAFAGALVIFLVGWFVDDSGELWVFLFSLLLLIAGVAAAAYRLHFEKK